MRCRSALGARGLLRARHGPCKHHIKQVHPGVPRYIMLYYARLCYVMLYYCIVSHLYIHIYIYVIMKTVGFHNFNLRFFNSRVSNPNKFIVDVFLTRCRISMCQGLGPNKNDETSEIDRTSWCTTFECVRVSVCVCVCESDRQGLTMGM